MLDNTITLTLVAPQPENDEDLSALTNILETQTSYIVQVWRDHLKAYKVMGVEVPVLSFKGIKKREVKVNPNKEVAQFLLDYHLKREPNANVPVQRMAINRLLETGLTKEELITLYEKSLSEYKLTTWTTVKYKLAHNKEEVKEVEFTPVVLDDSAISDLKQRVAGYARQHTQNNQENT